MRSSLLLAEFRAHPEQAAIMLDVDGTLAPIVERPENARVPASTKSLLRELADRYALVACVSGRSSAEARRVVGVEELFYIGTHGLELAPEAEVWRDQIERFANTIEWPHDWTENKGLALSLHYRRSPDPEQSRRQLLEIAQTAEEVGLRTRFGRMMLEILPPVDAGKGTAIRSLLKQRGLKRALYAGDDATDLDAFRALEDLELGICVALCSSEVPPGLTEAADIVLAGPKELEDLLGSL